MIRLSPVTAGARGGNLVARQSHSPEITLCPAGNQDVILIVGAGAGQEVFHTFTVRIVRCFSEHGPGPGRVISVRPDTPNVVIELSRGTCP
jgi:hypothetical protein